MDRWKFGFFPKAAAPCTGPLARVATSTHQSGSSTWELPCINIFFHGLSLGETGSFTFSWICMRTAFRKSLRQPRLHKEQLCCGSPEQLPKVLAAVPALGSFSSWDVPEQGLEVIYSWCVGKLHLCKWVFLDNQEILESFRTPGWKTWDIYLFFHLKQQGNAPPTCILSRKCLCFGRLFFIYSI